MAQIATGNREEALDIVQETMLRLVHRYSSRPEAEWRAIFFRILQNQIRDWYRRHSTRKRWLGWFSGKNKKEEEARSNPAEDLPDPSNPDPAEQTVRSDSITALEEALRTLSLRQQQAFLLRAWEELSVRETAHAMNCSEGTVKTHYFRAVQTLRNLLKDYAL